MTNLIRIVQSPYPIPHLKALADICDLKDYLPLNLDSLFWETGF